MGQTKGLVALVSLTVISVLVKKRQFTHCFSRQWCQAEMQVCIAGCNPSACCAHHKALLNKVGLDYIFNGAAFFTQRGGKAFNSDWPAIKLFNDGLQQSSIHCVEAVGIDLE